MATREAKRWQHFGEDRAQHEVSGPARKAPKLGRVRPKDWTSAYVADPDGYDDLDIADHERVVPRGETEARRQHPAGS